MKFLRLDLLAFGPFSGESLEFPADGPNLHLILGPNEAGKSSALRALRCLLFGFPPRTTDDHRHEYKNLRVGATLQAPGGSTLSFVRRKANSKTLRGPDDEAILPDDALKPFLGELGEARFAAVAMSNLAELVEGGESIIKGHGDFGEILFGASGLARLPEVRRALEGEAEILFKKGATAKNPLINAQLARLEAARKTIRESSLPPAEWEAADREHKQAIAQLGTIDLDLARLEAEHRRLDRLGRALPILADRREALARLADLGDAPILAEGFADRRRDAVAQRAASLDTARLARESIVGIEAEVAAIDVPDRLLAESKAIGTLREELGGLRKARAKRPRLVEQAAQAEAAATTAFRELSPGRPLGEAESLRLGKAQRARITSLGLQRGTIEAEVAKARDEVRALAARAGSCWTATPHPGPSPQGGREPNGLSCLPPSPLEGEGRGGGSASQEIETRRRLDDLAALVDRIQSRGGLEPAREAAVAEVRRLEAEAEVELARLPRWSGPLDDLARRPVPDPETIAGLEGRLGRAEAEVAKAVEAIRSHLAELADIEAEADQARAGGDPPSEADLARSRVHRDDVWRAVRSAWLDGASLAPAPELAISYEHLVNSADLLADALRREADRVAAVASREARRRRLIERGRGVERAREAAIAAVDRARSDWEAAWRGAGVEPGPTVEMRAWSARYRDLVARAAAIRSARLEADRAAEAVASARNEIAAALVALGEPSAGADGLATLVARAKSAIERGEAARDLTASRATLAEAEGRLESWSRKWAEAVRPLGLGPETSSELASEFIERLDGLFKSIDNCRGLKQQVDEIDAEAARYADEVADLARRVGRSAGEGTPEAVAEAMVAALEEAERDRARRDAALVRLQAERDRLTRAEATVRDLDALLDALCREAGCDSPDDLPAAERRSAEAKARRDRIDNDERDLLGLAAGATVADLAREAEGLDADALPSRIEALAQRIEALRSERDGLNREVGRLGELLRKMDGRELASVALEEARQWLAGIEADIEQYARLKLASAVLKKAIERYRDRHQGPVLRRLGDLFAGLTAGSFAGVVLDDDREGPPVLQGLRAGTEGELVPVEGMSEGTADALYLAVRLATLETYLDAHPPLPFVVDDILVHLDDARASAALAALARLATRTQVLFFTHHDHLIELARAGLPGDAWRLHHLPGRSPA
jgi:uncharacterized protein YhaN